MDNKLAGKGVAAGRWLLVEPGSARLRLVEHYHHDEGHRQYADAQLGDRCAGDNLRGTMEDLFMEMAVERWCEAAHVRLEVVDRHHRHGIWTD